MPKTTFVFQRHHDVLSHALGKNVYSSHIKGCGVYVMIRDVYEKPSKTEKTPSGVLSMDGLK